jgi:hypothetical protein
MVHPSIIEARLGELGFRSSRWFKAEIQELEHILMDDEKIIALACGRYFGSFALLVATDLRLLLIDKRVFFMTVEDTRYDMISEIDYNAQVYNATVTVYTMNKTHKFTSIKFKRQLRELTNYVQRRVWEFRQQQPSADGPPTAQIQSNTSLTARRRRVQAQPFYQAAAVTPQSSQPPANDYYIQDEPASHNSSQSRAKGQVAHAAHKVGSAATWAAHTTLPRRPVNPYTQGSLMTRRPIAAGRPEYETPV